MRMTQKLHRASILFFAFVLLGTVTLGSLAPQTAVAAPYSADSVKERSEAWMFGRAIGKCFKDSTLRNGFYNDQIDQDSAESGKWFYDKLGNTPARNVGVLVADIVEGNADDGLTECSNTKLVTEALERLGWASPVEALCAMGDVFKRENPGTDAKNSCMTGSGYFGTEDKQSNKIQDAWNNAWRNKYLEGKTMTSALTDDMRYYISFQTFVKGCKATPGGVYDGQSTGGDKKYKTPVYDEDTEKVVQYYYTTEKGNEEIDVGGNGLFYSNNSSKRHCKDIESDLDKWIDAYATAMQTSTTEDNGPGEGSSSSSGSTEPTCESEGGSLSWLVCPIMNALDGALSMLDSWINNLLFVDGDRYRDPSISEAWGTMRNIALLVLVPMMIFMVIGTAVGFGPFDPYTVKKALPRMLVAVLFIVLSLPITQFGVQLSNVVGQGVGNLIISASPTPATSLAGITAGNTGSASLVGFAGLVATGVGVGTGAITIGIVASFALVSFVALMIAFIILAMRQVLLITLMVLAPLAILVWIFPANDKLWTIWKTTFIAMLLMYPIIAALIASGRFVAGLFG